MVFDSQYAMRSSGNKHKGGLTSFLLMLRMFLCNTLERLAMACQFKISTYFCSSLMYGLPTVSFAVSVVLSAAELGAGDSVRSAAFAAFFLADLEGTWVVVAAIVRAFRLAGERAVGFEFGTRARGRVEAIVELCLLVQAQRIMAIAVEKT